MRKLFLSVAVLLGLGVAAVSCSKDNKDKEEGEKAGKAMCDCVANAEGLAKFDCYDVMEDVMGKSNDYKEGFAKGSQACNEININDEE